MRLLSPRNLYTGDGAQEAAGWEADPFLSLHLDLTSCVTVREPRKYSSIAESSFIWREADLPSNLVHHGTYLLSLPSMSKSTKKE